MKRLIGSYVVSQYGELTKVDMHVPSTTYMNRGIYRLSPSDIEFLLDEQLITDNESYSMLLEDFLLYIDENLEVVSQFLHLLNIGSLQN